MKGRLFTFGCSFTEYLWPTWADILGKEFDYYENWGLRGGGNHFITNSVIECSVRNNITADDTVIIMWTTVTREDRYLTTKWLCPGNIYRQDIYDKSFVDKFITVRGCMVRDLALMYILDQYLQKIGCVYHYLTMTDIYLEANLKGPEEFYVDDVLTMYSTVTDKFKPSVYEIIFNYDWNSRTYFSDQQGDRRDLHPLPNEHIEYLSVALPQYKLSNKTIELANSVTIECINYPKDKKLHHGRWEHIWGTYGNTHPKTRF